tara:strand:- start:84 stop:545 length:462 start_codon:yes stop_codon:yes gene_type:complete
MKKTILLLLIIHIPNHILSNEIEKNKILNTLVNYNYEFIEANYDEIIDYFTFPVSINMSETTLNMKKEKNLKEFYKDLRGGLPNDYSHSDWKKMDVKILNDDIAIANTMFSRYKNNGEAYYTGAALYCFRKIDDSWKIFSLTPYKPYNYFEFE